MVDFHFLTKLKALVRAKQAIAACRVKGWNRAGFNVGRGRHSLGDIPVIKPAVQALLAERNLRRTLVEDNSVCLDVDLVAPLDAGFKPTINSLMAEHNVPMKIEMAEETTKAKNATVAAKTKLAKVKRAKPQQTMLSLQLRTSQLDRVAARSMNAELNAWQPEDVVDFHFLFKSDALERAEQAITACRAKRYKQVTFIVGKGNHSPGGIPILKPAIQALLAERNLRCTLMKANSGCLVVDLVTPLDAGIKPIIDGLMAEHNVPTKVKMAKETTKAKNATMAAKVKPPKLKRVKPQQTKLSLSAKAALITHLHAVSARVIGSASADAWLVCELLSILPAYELPGL